MVMKQLLFIMNGAMLIIHNFGNQILIMHILGP